MAEGLLWGGARWPLIQAPMAGSQGAALAVAVTRAGGLGSVPAALLTPAALAEELQRVAQGCAGLAAPKGLLPVNVNFFCHRMPSVQAEQLQAWQQVLQPYAQAWGVDLPSASAAGVRQPFDAAMAQALEAWRPAVVSFHFGLPEPELLEPLRSWGTRLMSTATTVAEARWLQRQGVDAVIAQGLEAGGHRGMFLTEDLATQVGTMALVPQLVRAVSVPVVAAGGIADAAGVRAAFALGASAVQVGTAFLGCPEATPSAVHRQALAQAHSLTCSPPHSQMQAEAPDHGAVATALTRLFSGRPARGLVNRLMQELGPQHPAAPPFPLASIALQPLRQKAEALGCADFSPLWCGQHPPRWMGRPAAEIIQELRAGLPTDSAHGRTHPPHDEESSA